MRFSDIIEKSARIEGMLAQKANHDAGMKRKRYVAGIVQAMQAYSSKDAVNKAARSAEPKKSLDVKVPKMPVGVIGSIPKATIKQEVKNDHNQLVQ